MITDNLLSMGRGSLALAIAVLALSAPSAKADVHTTGLRELSPEELAAYHERMYVVEEPTRQTRTPLPSRVINTAHLPAVGNQGQLGSCSAFAAGYYYKTYQEAREHGWIHPNPATHPERVASPMWAYNLSRRDERPENGGGISFYDAVDLFCSHGSASWAEMPYSETGDILYVPDDHAIFRRALEWRGKQAGRIPGLKTPSGIALLRSHLAGGDLAVIAVGIGGLSENFFNYPTETGSNGVNNGVFYRVTGTPPSVNGHALAVIGYDDNRSYVDDRDGLTHRGAFLAVNSWGPNWGVVEPSVGTKGFVWLAYDFVLAGGFESEAVVMLDRTAYQPTTLAVVGVDARSGRSVNYSYLKMGTARISEKPTFWINGNAAVNREFLFDISDWLNPPVMNLELEFFHADYLSAAPTLTVFRVESADGQVMMSATGMPVVLESGEQMPRVLHIASIQPATAGLEDLLLRSGSAAFADVNGNGRADLVVTGTRYPLNTTNTTASTTLWLNQGNGTFVESTGHGLPGTPDGEAAWSDVNNDGAPDLWIGWSQETRLYWNNGSGAFSDSGVRLPHTESGLLAATDYNRDGRPDVAIANENGVFVCRQEINGSFTAINLDARGIADTYYGPTGMMAWGDPDGDGFPDLFATGVGKNRTSAITVLYRNTGNQNFQIIEADYPDLKYGALAWADYDNDGDDDVAMSGEGGSVLLRGDGTGGLAEVPLIGVLEGVFNGRLLWADLNHDGRPDLMLTGREYDTYPLNPDTQPLYLWPNRTLLYANLGQNTFEEAELDLPGVSGVFGAPAMAVTDVSGDGGLGWFFAGTRRMPHESGTEYIACQFVRSHSAVYPGHGGENLAPTAPAGFAASVVTGGSVRFAWSGASDDVTPGPGLKYILRIGTTPGGGNIVSGAVDPSDFGNLVRSGVTYQDLPVGTIYWQVRSVDAGLRMSPWSAVQSVSVSGAASTDIWVYPRAYPAYGGTAVPADPYKVTPGSEITISATPAPGFVFAGWSGSMPTGSMANPLIMTATTHVHATALFTPREVVEPLPAGMGLLKLSFNNATGDRVLIPPPGEYMDTLGKVFALTAVESGTRRIDRWTGPVADPYAAQTTVVLGTQTVVKASFTYDFTLHDPVQVTIDAVPLEGGTITWPGTGVREVDRGNSIGFSATPATGWRFSHWSGPVSSPLTYSTIVTPQSNVTVTAHFVRQSLAAGAAHTAIRKDDGSLWVWGLGAAGQSGLHWMEEGNGLPPLASWQGVGSIAAGGGCTVARTTSGASLWLWGYPWTASSAATNAWDVEPASLSVSLPIGVPIRQVAAGGTAMLALGNDGSVWGSGLSTDHQLSPWWNLSTNMMSIPGYGGEGQLGNMAGVAMGHSHALSVDLQGQVWGWGRNGHGQVQPGLPSTVDTPTPIGGLPPCRMVAASQDALTGFSLAIDLTGKVWQWGLDQVPAMVTGLSNVVSISTGARHVLALDAKGQVYSWGSNDFGQLGLGDFDNASSPTPVSNLPVAGEVSAGHFHSVARTVDGRVFAWGNNIQGTVTGVSGDDVPAPVEIVEMKPSEPSILLSLQAEPENGGSIIPTRSSYNGRVDGVIPVTAVPAERYEFSHWQAGVADTNAITTTLTLSGSTTHRAYFSLFPEAEAELTVSVSPPASGVTTPEVGSHEYLVDTDVPLRADPAARYRFDSWAGPVNDPDARETTVAMTKDESVTATFERIQFRTRPFISAVDDEPIFVDRDSAVWSTRNTGTSYPQVYADRVLGPAGGTTYLEGIVQVAHDSHNLGLTADGTVLAWGSNYRGQCGLGYFSNYSTPNIARPTQVVGPAGNPYLANVIQVQTGYMLGMALTADGRIYEWGRRLNRNGNTFTNRPVALPLASGSPVTNATSLNVYSTYAAVVFGDGTVQTWSDTTAGVEVPGLSNVTKIALGYSYYIALLNDGTLRASGGNTYGQLGDGTTQTRSEPVPVVGLSNIVDIATGNYHSLALDDQGRVYVWGYNDRGQLGDATLVNNPVPARLSQFTDVAAIAIGDRTCFVVTEPGELYAWGGMMDYSNPPDYWITEPILYPNVHPGASDTGVVELRLTTASEAGSVFPANGVSWYNAGDEIELRAWPAPDYRFVQWSDGNTNAWRIVTLSGDLDLTADFVLIEPILRLEDVEAWPGVPVTMRVWMEEGKISYGGLNAGLRLPPGVSLSGYEEGGDIPDSFILDVRSRPASDGGSLVTLAAFGPEGAVTNRESEWAVLHLFPSTDAAAGLFPVDWMGAQAWAAGSPAAISDTNGVDTVIPTRIPGSIRMHRDRQVRAALRVVTSPASTDRMSDDGFAAYGGRTQYQTNHPYTVEAWLRYTGSNAAGVVSARVDLQVDGDPLVIGGLAHGSLFSQHVSGVVESQTVSRLGGSLSTPTGEGCDDWVRLGWVSVDAPRAEGASSWLLAFSDALPSLGDESTLTDTDTLVLDSPVTVNTQSSALPTTASGTPIWWLEENGLVGPGPVDYAFVEQLDVDGDGRTAREEFMAGTDPRDPESFFRMFGFTRDTQGMVISWNGIAGRSYSVLMSTDLTLNHWTPIAGPRPCSADGLMTYTNNLATTPRSVYYRINGEMSK